jgi:hypothetical protein
LRFLEKSELSAHSAFHGIFPPMTPKPRSDDHPRTEAQRRRDAALRAALSMQSLPHVESSPKKKPARVEKAAKKWPLSRDGRGIRCRRLDRS